jgi:NAD(P)-dependent dehydrogenase (short-subunit alcohol dehydrogenase family)
MKKVCLVIGAGAGIGGTVAKKFAADGFYAYLARRTDEEGLNKLIGEIKDSGGEASGSLLNDSINRTNFGFNFSNEFFNRVFLYII